MKRMFAVVALLSVMLGAFVFHAPYSTHAAVHIPLATCWQDSCDGRFLSNVTNCSGHTWVQEAVNMPDSKGHVMGVLELMKSGATNGCMAEWSRADMFPISPQVTKLTLLTGRLTEMGSWADSDESDPGFGGQCGPYNPNPNATIDCKLAGYEGHYEDCLYADVVYTDPQGLAHIINTQFDCSA